MNQQLNEKLPTMFEVLNTLQTKASKEDQLAYIKSCISKDKRIFEFLAFALNPTYTMQLPDDEPPYIPSQFHIELAPVQLLHVSNKLHLLYDKNLKQYKKEEIFIQWLEQMSPEEAKIFISVKDKNLNSLYPVIDDSFVCGLFGWDLAKYKELKQKYQKKI